MIIVIDIDQWINPFDHVVYHVFDPCLIYFLQLCSFKIYLFTMCTYGYWCWLFQSEYKGMFISNGNSISIKAALS